MHAIEALVEYHALLTSCFIQEGTVNTRSSKSSATGCSGWKMVVKVVIFLTGCSSWKMVVKVVIFLTGCSG